MSTKVFVSVEDYLATSFPDLDREYREGEIVERTPPDYKHGRAQKRLAALFDRLEGQGISLFAATELRLRVAERRFLIPDVCVFSPAEPSEAVPASPPHVVIEVSSPEDSFTAIRAKLEEYRNWGVPHVWLVDPHSRRLYVCTTELCEVPTFRIPDLAIEITATQIFD